MSHVMTSPSFLYQIGFEKAYKPLFLKLLLQFFDNRFQLFSQPNCIS